MQVAEKKVEGLKREFTVTVPANDIEKQVESRLAEVGQTVRLPGFRPGKAPVALIKQRYGQSVQAEVLEKTIGDTSRDLMSERNLRPAMQPKVEIEEFGDGKDLKYSLAVEVLPEITPCDFKTITIERLVVEPKAEDVTKAIEDLAKMRKPLVKVEEKRAARTGDTVELDFDGSVDGERRPGMKAEKFRLELGSKSFIDTFEEQLAGLKAGESKSVNVTFPENYGEQSLAGKAAVFECTIHDIYEPGEVKIDDELAKGFGIESLDKLKEQVTQNMSDSYKQAARVKAKRILLDELAKAHSFEVPQGMVDFEFATIWQQREQQGPDPEEKGTTEDEIKAEYRDIAERRVRLGLLLAEIGRKQNIDVSQDDLRQAVFQRAREFPGQERQVLEFYMQNQQALDSLRAPLFEDKVVDYIFELVNVKEKAGTVDDLKADTDEGSDAAADEKPKAKKKAAKKE